MQNYIKNITDFFFVIDLHLIYDDSFDRDKLTQIFLHLFKSYWVKPFLFFIVFNLPKYY